MGAGGATGGQGEPVYCPACRFVILGRWQDERGRRVFRPNLHAARSVAYDSNIAGDHEDWTYCAVDTPYMPIRKGGPERAADYPDRTLLLIWPPYAEPMAHDALRAFTGRTLVYIGEGDGGCTGDDAFHALIDAEWDEIADHAVPQWWGLHDHLWIYRRKGAARLP
jgi:hypothetical protein